mmetsp:Transcript_10776/g.24268  ORF Transcript_10776/g.24268 Transcript_10776/m.24268 type:complete len:225 (+) Transcript_10776:715-1389(+)
MEFTRSFETPSFARRAPGLLRRRISCRSVTREARERRTRSMHLRRAACARGRQRPAAGSSRLHPPHTACRRRAGRSRRRHSPESARWNSLRATRCAERCDRGRRGKRAVVGLHVVRARCGRHTCECGSRGGASPQRSAHLRSAARTIAASRSAQACVPRRSSTVPRRQRRRTSARAHARRTRCVPRSPRAPQRRGDSSGRTCAFASSRRHPPLPAWSPRQRQCR